MNNFLPPAKNLSGWSWMVDTNLIDDLKAEKLFSLYKEGWVYLQLPDTAFLEVLNTSNPELLQKLLTKSSSFFIAGGPIIANSSLNNFGIMGTTEDHNRINDVHRSLWQDHTFEADNLEMDNNNNKKARSRVRDTLIICNALRLKKQALVTEDKKLIKNSENLAQMGFRIELLNLDEAINRVEKFKSNYLLRNN